MTLPRNLRGLCFCLLLMGQAGHGHANDVAIRVSFWLNFGRFAEWPAKALAPKGDLYYCLAPGDAEFSREAPALEKQQIQGHAIKVVLINRAAEVAACHTLFLPADMSAPFEPFLKVAENTGALTVSDLPGFTDKGGMIELVPVNGRYRFDVNLVAVKRAELYLSTNLLKLARSVK